MCLAMNPDKLQGGEIAASSLATVISKVIELTKTGRTLLMSPAMVALAALNGAVSDIRPRQPA